VTSGGKTIARLGERLLRQIHGTLGDRRPLARGLEVEAERCGYPDRFGRGRSPSRLGLPQGWHRPSKHRYGPCPPAKIGTFNAPTTVYVGSTSPGQLDFAKIRGHIHGGIPFPQRGVSLQLRGAKRSRAALYPTAGNRLAGRLDSRSGRGKGRTELCRPVQIPGWARSQSRAPVNFLFGEIVSSARDQFAARASGIHLPPQRIDCRATPAFCSAVALS